MIIRIYIKPEFALALIAKSERDKPMRLQKVATHIRISPSYLSNLMARRRAVPAHVAKRFVNYFRGCRIDDMFEHTMTTA